MKKLFIVAAILSIACAGPKGDTGVEGLQGDLGPQGPAGADSAQIGVVQFCQGVAPSYPSTFPEYGLCIEGKLYGVYSTHGGFLAELPDGTYSSDAVGSACTFTISGCSVQQ